MGILHASLLRMVPGVEIAAVCDRRRPVLRVLRRLWPSARAVARLEDLAGETFRGLVVTTPIPSHASLCEAALSSGMARNVLVEKTLASSAQEAERLARLAVAHDGMILVGYQRRFSVTFRKAKELLEEGAIGRPKSFDAYALSSDGLSVKNRRAFAEARGGVLRDLGSHAISLALWYFGDLHLEEASPRPPGGREDGLAAVLHVGTPEGASGRIRCSWIEEGLRLPEVGLAIRGTEGALEVTDDFVRLRRGQGEIRTMYRHDLDDRVDFLLGGSEYFRQDAFFIEAARAGRRLREELGHAVRVERIIDGARAPKA